MKQIIFLLIISSALFSSCSRCDEMAPGDCNKCYERLAGDWTLNYLATNGIDSVDYYDSVYQTSCIITFYPYDKHSDGTNFGISWGDTSANYFSQGGLYGGIDDNANLIMYDYSPPSSNLNNDPFTGWLPLPQGAGPKWKINMLSDNELSFELDNHEMHLSK